MADRIMIRELSLQEMQEIYDGQMQEDFPPAEIKPFSTIRLLYERGEYLGLGMLTKEGSILAYAFFVVCRPPGQGFHCCGSGKSPPRSRRCPL